MLILNIVLSFVTIFLSGVFWRDFRISKIYFHRKSWWDLAFCLGLAAAGIFNLISLVGLSAGA
jgi:hypothetical protein